MEFIVSYMNDIISNNNIKNGRPIIKGSKISVLQIKEMVIDSNISIDTIVYEYNNLTRDKVKSALQYIDNNPNKINELEMNKEQERQELNNKDNIYRL